MLQAFGSLPHCTHPVASPSPVWALQNTGFGSSDTEELLVMTRAIPAAQLVFMTGAVLVAQLMASSPEQPL